MVSVLYFAALDSQVTSYLRTYNFAAKNGRSLKEQLRAELVDVGAPPRASTPQDTD